MNLFTSNDPTNMEVRKEIFSISTEYDMMRENYFCKDNIDRSQWMENIYSKNPSVKKFREQVSPVDRAIEFGNLYLPEERIINQDGLFAIISQHFHTIGLLNSEQTLLSEWEGCLNYPTSLNKSQLTYLIQRGIQNSEKFWLLTTPGTMPNETEEKITKKVLNEFEKITGKENFSEPILEESEDINQCIFDQEGNIVKATVNQLIWICTTQNIYNSKYLTLAFCLVNSSFSKNSNIMFYKIRHRLRIALNMKTNIENSDLKLNSGDELSTIEGKPKSINIKSEKDLLMEEKNNINSNSKGMQNNTQLDLKPDIEKNLKSNSPITQAISSEFQDINEKQFKEQKMTLKFLSIWIDQSFFQISPSVISSILSFLHDEVPTKFSKKVIKIKSKIEKIIQYRKNQFSPIDCNDIENEIDYSVSSQQPPKVNLNSHRMPWSLDFELTDLPSTEFARQLTMFMSRSFYKIKGCELVYSSEDQIEQNQPNLNILITKSNNFFRWIQFYVLSKSEINERAAMMSYFIRVARKLYTMQNFYGCSLILSAFDNSFNFLKGTKALISKSDLNFIEEVKNQLVDFDSDSSTIQQFFRESSLKMPVIPVLYPYKSSIQSAIKGRLIENDKINVPVLIEIYKLVCEFEDFQKKRFNFYLIDQAQDLLEKCNSPKTLNELIDYAKQLE